MSELRFRLFLRSKKSASIAFWYQNAACRENPDPNAATGRKINGRTAAQVRKRTSAQPFAPLRGARCADVCGFYGPTAHPCRSALHKRRVRPPWRREENRMKNFDWVILFGYSKPILIPRMGEQCEEQKCAWRGIGLAIQLCLW